MADKRVSTFRKWRYDMGFTQLESAEKLGKCRSQIAYYDEGKKEPGVTMRLAMLALSKGLSLDENSTPNADSLAA